MKSLRTLIRLKKQQMDELRRQLSTLETQKQQLVKRSVDLNEELSRELALAGKQQEMAGFFGDFADRIKRRQLEIAKEVRRLDRNMDDIREQIRTAFGEVKKYEIVQERRKLEEQQQQDRKETAQMDEVAASQDQRKKKKK